MTALIIQVRSVLNKLSKAKAAKLVRGLIDMFLEMREENEDGCREIKLCKVHFGKKQYLAIDNFIFKHLRSA